MESERQRGKLPGEDTGIEIRHTVCGMCCSSIYCGVDAYIQDGRVIKVEGSKEHFMNQGLLCAKGQGIRQYLYKPTRLKTPLRRVGERGEGKFEPISWEEAYRTMAEQMNRIKRESGPEAVAFYSGYEKWYRPFFTVLPDPSGLPITVPNQAPAIRPKSWRGWCPQEWTDFPRETSPGCIWGGALTMITPAIWTPFPSKSGERTE